MLTRSTFHSNTYVRVKFYPSLNAHLTHVSNGKFYLQLGLDGRKVRAAQMFDGGRTGDVA